MVGSLFLVTVGAGQVLEPLNAYDKDLFCEYHYSFFKCFESARRTTDAEPFVLLSKWRMVYPEILAQKFIFYPRPSKYMWDWNKSVLYLVIVSQAI